MRILLQSEPNIIRRKIADPVDTLGSGTVFSENYVDVVVPVPRGVPRILPGGMHIFG
jgi:hypothetical protein